MAEHVLLQFQAFYLAQLRGLEDFFHCEGLFFFGVDTQIQELLVARDSLVKLLQLDDFL